MSNEKEKSLGEQLREQLGYKTKNGVSVMSAEEIAAADAYCEGYKHYLDVAKTEREAVDEAIAMAVAAGLPVYRRTARCL